MAVFQRVVVLMSPQGQGHLGLARVWARGLHVPLQPASLPDDPHGAIMFPNSSWETTSGSFQPTDLFICGQDVPAGQKKSLLREAHRRGGPTLLFGAKGTFLPSRILLIDQGDPFADQLLEITVQLCEIFRAGLVVLTVARTEREACQRQRRARETFEGSPVHVNFDFLAGTDVRSAAASVARWRRCQLVVLEANSAWGRWLGFHLGSWITERLESLSLLVFPAAPVLEMLPRQPSLPESQERGEAPRGYSQDLMHGGPAGPLLQSEAGRGARSFRNP